MVKAAEQLVDGILDGLDPHWLCLLGMQGTGKTHLAKEIRSTIRANKRTCQLWRWTTILDRLRNGDYGLKDWLRALPVLIVDDLGSGYETAFSKATAEELADARLGRWTVWTSNLDYSQIGEELSWRLHSRMRRGGSVVVEILNTEDWSQR